ncbi:MAG: glycogen/starch synthase [Prevotellaceae bacterium]|nr:glycogen/starch synthase [Candidatus Faecinaster equi]
MEKKRILFVAHEIAPYIPDTQMGANGRKLALNTQNAGNELRSFVPKWGIINERRHQLHEVIRLSKMNVVINETDYPLIVKVATLQPSHSQVYFTYTDELFLRKCMANNADGSESTENLRKAIFFARCVLDTAKKLRWIPDIIHCQGWIADIVPFYLKTVYADDPTFSNAKIVTSVYHNELTLPIPEDANKCLEFRDLTADNIEEMGISLKTPTDMDKLAIRFSDAVILSEDNIAEDVKDYISETGIMATTYDAISTPETINNFYEGI